MPIKTIWRLSNARKRLEATALPPGTQLEELTALSQLVAPKTPPSLSAF